MIESTLHFVLFEQRKMTLTPMDKATKVECTQTVVTQTMHLLTEDGFAKMNALMAELLADGDASILEPEDDENGGN